MIRSMWERLDTSLTGLIASILEDPDAHRTASKEDREAFDAYTAALTARACMFAALVLLVQDLLFWPTDSLLFPLGSIEHYVIVGLRWEVLVVSAIAVLGFRFSQTCKRHPFEFALLVLAVGLGVPGWLYGRYLGFASHLSFNVYSMPLVTVLLVVPLLQRCVAAGTIVAAHLLCFLIAVDPALVRLQVLGSVLIWLAATSSGAILVGHTIYILIRSNFLQRRLLDRHARELEELDRLKNEFFANLSHELRTPLTNILGAFRTLEKRADADALPGLVDVGIRNADHLLLQVGDLLELASLDSGRSTRRREVVNLGDLAGRVAAEFRTGEEQRVVVEIDAKAGRPVAVVDPRQVRIVLYNLLSNAFKFSDPQSQPVRLDARVQDNAVVITVRDEGIGIPADQLERVFDRFYQLDGGHFRRGGAGIGLSLVKEIVVAHGGSVAVVSELGRGATFTVRIPRGDVADATPISLDEPAPVQGLGSIVERRVAGSADIPASLEPDGPSANGNRPLVLVVEDDADLRAYLLRLLRPRYRVAAARDGVEGLDKARVLRPDLVLTDVMMPRLSGLELLRALRGEAELASIPCVLLTALAGAEARIEALDRGASDYVTKPFREAELLARIDNLIRMEELTRHLERRVAEQTGELRTLATNLASVQEEERLRIAREVHDELGQVFTGLRLELDGLRYLANAPSTDCRACEGAFGQIDELLTALHESLQSIINALRPSVLDTLGFAAAIHNLSREFERRNRIACNAEVGVDEERLGDEQSIALFRIVQEALTNVSRHARAKTVEVVFEEAPECVTLRIHDDGVGFDPSAPMPRGCGLLGIRERARQLGGRAEISSAPGGGTRIVVSVPMSADNEVVRA